MNEENNEESKQRRVGIANVLPPEARTILVNAAAIASQYEEDSVKRKRIIERAIDEVRSLYPRYFKRSSTTR